MPDKKIKLIIADDHTLVRKALKALLEDDSRFKVIAEANNGEELLELLKSHQPDIVLLDIEMPVMSGRDTLNLIRRDFPKLKVIMLSMHSEAGYISEFISMGARAYVPKGSDEALLVQTLLSVHQEGYYYGPETANALVKNLLRKKAPFLLYEELPLSPRETEILKHLCGGKTNKEIADALSITAATVNFHRANIYRKTQSHNISDLIKYSLKKGVIDLDRKMAG